MSYKKAILDITLFDIEDVITTSDGSGSSPTIIDEGPLVPPVPQPEPFPQPQPEPPIPEDSGTTSSN